MKYLRKSAFTSTTCLHGAAFAAAMFAATGATAAQAQDAAPADSAETCVDNNNNGTCDADEKGDLVVTGSRLTRPTLSSPTPITTVSVGELTNQGKVSLGDALNDLPSLRSTFSSGNSTRFIGTAGLNILDLRGLGTSRTLVLVNGRRHITASPGDYLVDVNTIPVDLLERVDVVTGGNSAIYGSDAVAGVVNFVLKRDFEGLSIRGQGGISSHHDRGSYFVSGTWGKNFADGRGNLAVSAEYAKSEPVYFVDRDDLAGAFSGRCQFNTVEPTGGEPFGTDGIFDQAYVCGVRNASISDGGTLGAIDAASNPTRRYLRFAPDGSVVIDTPTLAYSPVGSGNQVGGTGSTLRNTGMILAGVQRYDVNVLFHYDFSDALQFYAEGKYVNVKANQEGQPSFFQGSIPGFFGGGANLRCNNAFLTAGALTTMQGFGLCPTPATSTFTMSRFNIDLGGRGEKHTRETYRFVGGFRGDFNEDWNYDLSVNYGEFRSKAASTNNLKLFDINGNDDGFLLATQAVLAPVGYTGTNFVLNSTGQKVVCSVNSVTNTRPDCVPLNLFGFGAADPRAIAFVNTEGLRTERATELDVNFSVAGDLSQLFSLPGGPIGFVLGTEYREETARSEWDPLVASGGTFLNAIQPFLPPKLTVKEAYGEIDLPLLKDVPFFKELTVRGAGRVSDYNTTAGTVWAWNVDGIWAPVSDIRFRAAYATSVRTPTQSDLYATASQNFAFIADPCDSLNITAGPNRAANCAAAGVPTTYNAASQAACASTSFTGVAGVTPWANCTARSQSTGFLSGGNPTLQAEKGKSLTLGVVVEPHWIPGLNFTVDYYRIEVTSLIATLGAQTIINLCYDSPSLANAFCGTVSRDPATGLFNDPAVISGGVNFAKQKTEGMDFDLSYRHTFDNGQKLSMRAIATRVVILDNYVDPTLPTLPNRQLGELGDPLWAANFSFNYDFGPVDITYGARYTGKMTIGSWEAQNTYTGVCPASGVTGFSGRTCTAGQLAVLDPQNNDLTQEKFYPGVIYHNVRVNFETGDKKYNFYVGIDNLMDKKPPFGLLGTAGGDPYDTIGRFFYAGFNADF
ncbi:MAG: TonB-dependent receptor [Novosphingobium sp.]|uniref:TonB-dependent receptor domain-containing protein n=1 Tax=Novosphingobium sp. TaxID=1874826 RepID=UPI003C798155